MQTIITLGELRESLKDYSDNDLVVIETNDENGDQIGLFNFYVDIAPNVQLIDENGNDTIKVNGNDTIKVNEIRFCQELDE